MARIQPHILKWFPFVFVIYEMGTYLSNDMYLPGLPQIAQEFKVSQDQAQYTLSLWFLGSGTLQLFVGPLSERFGRRPVLLFGVLLFITSTLGCMNAGSIEALLLTRFIQGTSICFMIVCGYSTVHALYTSKQAIRIISIMASLVVMSIALGPLTGAFLLEWMTWRGLFGILSIWGILCFAALYLITPETIAPEAPKTTLRRTLISYRSIFSNPQFIRFALSYGLLLSCVFVWIVETPFVIIDQFQKSKLYFGFAQLGVFVAFSLGAQLAHHLLKKRSPSLLIALGFSLVSLGILGILGSSFSGETLTRPIIFMACVTLGVALSLGCLNRLAIESSREPIGCSMAALSTLVGLSGGLNSFIMTQFNDKSFFNIGLVMTGIFCFILCLFFGLYAPLRLRDESLSPPAARA